MWAMWHQQYQNKYFLPISNHQRLNIKPFINYRPHRNEWSVQFCNVHYDFSIYQIHRIFGFFGKISSVVQCPGFDRRVYINYESEIDAKRCVVGIVQQGFINLRVFPKTQNSNPMDNCKSTINNDDNLNLGNISSVKSDVINGNLSTSDSSVTSNFSGDSASDKNQIKTNLFKDLSSQTPKVFFEEFKENNLSKLSGNSKIGGDQLISGDEKSILIANTTGKSEESVTISCNSREHGPQTIIEAQEVIVANIPEPFGIFYVLHLLEKFEPIGCSEIKTLEKNSIRYCHVYFKTAGDAEAAETDFDNVELTGRNLIVMRPHTLAEEADK